MKAQTRFAFIGLIVLIALISSIALPITALADEAPTPPPASDSSGSAQPAQPAQGDDASAPAQPAQPADTSAPAVSDTSAPAQPADTSAPTEPPPAVDTSAPATDAPAATQDPTTAVATDTPAPADTTTDTNSPAATDTPVVVVNSDGTVEPLATQAAANIIATGDPMWCPSGVTPNAGCTGATYFNGVGGLLSLISGKTESGTIWIASTYNSSGEGGPVNLNSALGTTADHPLTLQGGWSGNYDTIIISTSSFNVPLIIDWNSDVTVKDINITGTTFNGLQINTTGNISVNNVKSNHNSTGSGAYLDNCNDTGSGCTGNGSIDVKNSIFNDNDNAGLFAKSTGTITLTDVTANDNGRDGAYLNNTYGAGNIIIQGSSNTFNGNGTCGFDCETSLDGLEAYSSGDITLTGVTADGNGYDGAYLDNTSGSATAGIYPAISVDNTTGGEFNGNTAEGLDARSNGNITLNYVTVDANGSGGWDGASLDNSGGNGNIIVSNSVFGDSTGTTGNGWNGLEVYSNGDVTLTKVIADNNSGDEGLGIYTYGNVTLKKVTASKNGAGDGAYISDFANLLIEDSTFNDNHSQEINWGYGLYIESSTGNVTLSNVQTLRNSSSGYDAGENPPAGPYSPTEDLAHPNWSDGTYIDTTGEVIVYNSQFDNNTTGSGLEIASAGNVILKCSDFSSNGNYGIDDYSPNPLKLKSDTFAGNFSGDYSYPGTAEIGSIDCSGSGGGSKGGGSPHEPGVPLPIHTVNVPDGASNGLDCTQYSGTQLIMSNNEGALFPCPISDSASINSLTSDKLPGALPNTDTFVAGMTTTVLKNGTASTRVNGPITVSFVIPDNMKNAKLAILFWDGSKWVKIHGHRAPNGHFEALTPLTGTFVLVSE